MAEVHFTGQDMCLTQKLLDIMAISLGAAWVLKTKFCSILTKEMSFEMMKGVVNQSKIAEELEATKAEITADLNKDIHDMFKKAFKGNKYIKIK